MRKTLTSEGPREWPRQQPGRSLALPALSRALHVERNPAPQLIPVGNVQALAASLEFQALGGRAYRSEASRTTKCDDSSECVRR
jgi:hypothetical protein